MPTTFPVVNYSPHVFTGWVRRGTDIVFPHERGMAGKDQYALGNINGDDTRVLDVFVRKLEPFEVRWLEIADDPSAAIVPGDETAEVRDAIPPSLHIAGQPLHIRSVVSNGVGLDIHLKARVGPMLVVDVRTTLYPGQPFARATVDVTACNPEVTDLVGIVPKGFTLEAKGGEVLGGKLPPAGTSIGTGQRWPTQPITIFWGDSKDDLESARAHSKIACIAMNHVWPRGNPLWPASAPGPTRWTLKHYPVVEAQLGGWEGYRELGIVPNAHVTGREGDQVFVGGECARGAASLGTEEVNRLVAYGYVRRPIHYLEADGDPLDIDAHPDLCLWDGKPFPRGGSKDLLGKLEVPSAYHTNGWQDWAEHEYFNRQALAARLTADASIQDALGHQARQFLFSATIDSKFTTSRAGPAREWGWKCLAAYQLWKNLADRDLAHRVRDRWLEHFTLKAEPKWRGQAYWDIRRDWRLQRDSGIAVNWLAYQQAPAAYFTWLCGQEFDAPDAAIMGLEGAKAVVDKAFSIVNGRWRGWAWVGVKDNDAPTPELHQLAQSNGAHYGPGVESWMVTAVAAVAVDDPTHPHAQAILDQYVSEAAEGGRWIPPEAR